jgi:CubicO group peptidase (beta-lactamase class C family)
MKKNIFIYFLIFLFAFPWFGLSQNNRYDQINTLYEGCTKPDMPGGFAIAVIKDGEVVFKKGFGYANYEHKIPFTPNTVADFASVAKQFTGFSVAVLVKKRKLDLNDDIRIYLPDLPDFNYKITIRDLLYHTSGIRDWVGLAKISGRYKEDVITDDFIMKLVKNQKDLNFKPCEKFQYSNTGYFLLAKIISGVTGKSFREWTQENIFTPLQMDNTHFSDDYREIIFNRASPYRKNDGGHYVNNSSNLESYGSSSLFSTLDDMTKWVLNFEKKKIGGDELWNMVLKGGTVNNVETKYGFGISLNINRGHENFGHGGSWGGYLCQLSYFPAENFGYILISNRDPSGVYVEEKLYDIFLGKKVKKESKPNSETKPRAEVEIDNNILKDFEGDYLFRDFIIRAEKKGNQLVIHFPWESGVKVYPESDEKFFRKDFDVQFSFLRDQNGKVNRMIYHYCGSDNPPSRKLEYDASKCIDVNTFCGDYYCPELQTSYEVNIKNKRLIVEHLQNEVVSLIQIDKDTYLGDKWWFKNVNVLRDDKSRIEGFKLNADNNNIQNLIFKRN